MLHFIIEGYLLCEGYSDQIKFNRRIARRQLCEEEKIAIIEV